jgi:hypothetical protein
MARSAAFIGATLGLALILGACSPQTLGLPKPPSTGSGGSIGHPSGTGDGGMSTSGQGGASGGSGSGGDIGGSTGTLGDGGGDIGGTGTGNIGGGSGMVPEGDPCMVDGDCAGMLHFCLRSACDAAMGICTAMPSEASCAAPACSSDDPPCAPPSSDANEVCGCDHVTYYNQCDAEAHGITPSILTGGCSLPSLPTTPCSSLAGCLPAGASPASYAKVIACVPSYCGSPFGTCVLIGQACMSALPTDGSDTSVCGCNDTTYSSVCAARAQGVTVAQPDAGACSTTP